jgi:hypothetical protein
MRKILRFVVNAIRSVAAAEGAAAIIGKSPGAEVVKMAVVVVTPAAAARKRMPPLDQPPLTG